MKITVDGQTYEVERHADDVTVAGETFRIRIESSGNTRTVLVNDFPYRVEIPDEPVENDVEAVIKVDGRDLTVKLEGALRSPRPAARSAAPAAAPKRADIPAGAVVAAMGGRIVSVHVEVGQQITAGTLLIIVEAMKMENEIKATKDGTVKALEVAAGARVNEGDVLIVIE